MRPPPPLLALLAGVAQQRWTPGSGTTTSGRAAAATLVAAGSLGLAAASAVRFRRAGTTVEPFEPAKATALVTSGVNGLTRNPMYVGMAGVLVANALRLGSWRALLPVATFVAVIDRFQVAAEERALAANFGAEYDAYREAVPRWLDARSARRRTAARRRAGRSSG